MNEAWRGSSWPTNVVYMLCECLIKLILYIVDMFIYHAYDVCVIMFPEKNLSLIPVSIIGFSQSEVFPVHTISIHTVCQNQLIPAK